MERLKSPWWWVNRASMLLVLLPAVYGWWWAVGNFHLSAASANALLFGFLGAGLYAVVRYRAPGSGEALFERLAFVFALSAFASPAMFVYLYVAAYYQPVYLAILAFLVLQFAVRAVNGVRRFVGELRSDPA